MTAPNRTMKSSEGHDIPVAIDHGENRLERAIEFATQVLAKYPQTVKMYVASYDYPNGEYATIHLPHSPARRIEPYQL